MVLFCAGMAVGNSKRESGVGPDPAARRDVGVASAGGGWDGVAEADSGGGLRETSSLQ